MADPFDSFDDEEDQEQEAQQEDPPAKQRLDREKAKLRKELDELKAWKAEREKADRGATVAGIAKELGLNPRHAQFYQGEDASPEAIKAWAVENEFLANDADAEPAAAPTGADYAPTDIGGLPVGTKMYSFEEYEDIRKSNPFKADELRRAGRVQPVERPWAIQP